MEQTELERIAEAILFAAGEPSGWRTATTI